MSIPESDVYRNCDKVMMVDTNMGAIPLEDYREIKAQQYGFDSYDEFYAAGYRLGKDIDKRNNLKKTKNQER